MLPNPTFLVLLLLHLSPCGHGETAVICTVVSKRLRMPLGLARIADRIKSQCGQSDSNMQTGLKESGGGREKKEARGRSGQQ